jgi:2-C-methyl-D-erythritol 4-phosphate cytidylyltransferase
MIWAIVPAAGSGSRSGSAIPKQYQHIAGQPMLHHSLDVLCQHPDIDGIILALANEDLRWQGISVWRNKPLRTCLGGAERSDSVLSAINALADVLGSDDFVLVHDAARPCLRFEDLHQLIQLASVHPVGALLAGKIKDTMKRSDSSAQVEGTIDRNLLWRAFTPQMFPAKSLQRALQHAKQEGASITDESSAMERLGLSPLLVEGAEDNIKVTLASDFALAEAILSARNFL